MYKCEYCGKDVYEKFGSGRFCSRSCANRFNSKNQSLEAKRKKTEAGRKNLIHDGPVGAACKDYWTSERRQEHSKTMSAVMSNPMVRKKISDSSTGRSLSTETRQKISKKVKLAHLEGRNKGWTTRKNQESYAEKFWRKVLEDNRIEFQQEVKIDKPGFGCYFLDFLLDKNIDLEIDGHQHYEESCKLKDIKRDNYLTSKGYTVYRIKFVNPKNSLKVKEDINRFLSWYRDL